MDPKDFASLNQQMGKLQGTLEAVNGTIMDFKSEVRSLTTDQNGKIEGLRKEVTDDLRNIQDTIKSLDDGKFDKAEAVRMKEEAEKVYDTFALKTDLDLIKKIVYGAVAFILLAFLTAVVATYIKG